MSAVKDDTTIRPGERAELRTLVRMRVKLLRSQIADRHATQMAQIDGRIANKFCEDRTRVEALRKELDKIVARANRAAQAALARYPDVAEMRTHMFSRPYITRPDQGKEKLRKAMVAMVTAQTEAAKLRVAQLEAELLGELALSAIKTEAAKEFVRTIPEIEDLMPAEPLAQIETRFDAERLANEAADRGGVSG
jgi:hypothetical protein